MASELRVDTLKDSSGNNSVGMAYVAGGSAKGWLQFNQDTPATTGSFNTSSVTDESTGEFDHNLTSAMVNTSDVAIVGMANHDSGDANVRGVALQRDADGTFTSSRFPIEVVDMGNGSTQQDQKFIFIVIHGDLA